ncbi:MAG: hypothetical protein FIB00_10435 [Chloroflexi bacterium]|nr:hypothetical protein [Chloroflexota bacterium]PWB42695.1 MAG: hypothetical protein C3F10_13215 [Dehalococcoidia bacterium]
MTTPEPSWEDAFMPAHCEHVASIINHAIQRLSTEKQRAIWHGLESKKAEIVTITTQDPAGVVVLYRNLATGVDVALLTWGAGKPLQMERKGGPA